MLPPEVGFDFAELTDGVLPAFVVSDGLVVFTGDGRGFAEAVLGLTGPAAFGFDAAGLGAERAFGLAAGAAGLQVLAFFGTLGPAIARLPPVVVSLRPKGLEAV